MASVDGGGCKPPEYDYRRMAERSRRFPWLPKRLQRYVVNLRTNFNPYVVMTCTLMAVVATPLIYDFYHICRLGPQRFVEWEKEMHMKNRNKWKYGEDLHIPFFGKVEIFAPEEIAAYKRVEEMRMRQQDRGL